MSLIISRSYKRLFLARQKIEVRSLEVRSLELVKELDNEVDEINEDMKRIVINLNLWLLREKIKKHQKIIDGYTLTKREKLLEETKIRRMLSEIKELKDKKISLNIEEIYFFIVVLLYFSV